MIVVYKILYMSGDKRTAISERWKTHEVSPKVPQGHHLRAFPGQNLSGKFWSWEDGGRFEIEVSTEPHRRKLCKKRTQRLAKGLMMNEDARNSPGQGEHHVQGLEMTLPSAHPEPGIVPLLTSKPEDNLKIYESWLDTQIFLQLRKS